MTPAQKKRRVLKLVRELSRVLLVDRYQIAVTFYETRDDLARASRGTESYAAGSHSDPEYGQASLGFVLDEWPEESLEEVVLHELMHIPLQEMGQTLWRWAGSDPERREAARDRSERAVGHMTRVVGELLGVTTFGVTTANDDR